MMKYKPDYIELRDKLFSEIKGIPGVISVGLTDKNGAIALLVAINSKRLSSKLPNEFKGVDIILKDFGKVKKYDCGGKYEFKY